MGIFQRGKKKDAKKVEVSSQRALPTASSASFLHSPPSAPPKIDSPAMMPTFQMLRDNTEELKQIQTQIKEEEEEEQQQQQQERRAKIHAPLSSPILTSTSNTGRRRLIKSLKNLVRFKFVADLTSTCRPVSRIS